MSSTDTSLKFPHQDGEVSEVDLMEHAKNNPHLYQGTLGEAVLGLGAESEKQLGFVEVKDSIGWTRLVLDTPAEGIKVMFKGRFDIPQVEEAESAATVVSLRPLYGDERRGLGRGIKSEQQIAYAGARGSDPRQVTSPRGAVRVVERALQESHGGELLLVCDETPQGFRALFQAIQSISGDSVLSDLARRLCAAEYDGINEAPAETKELFSQLTSELTAALTDKALTPHEALVLVYRSHVGSESSRQECTLKLNEILSNRLKLDRLADDEPEAYQERKNEFVEALKDPERNDFYVHRDKGILRPGQLILSGGSYVDYARFTTHGCLNVAIDVERNIYGSGGHGVAEEGGSTTVASPMARFVEINGMPVNLEAADTYFINHQGLGIPEGSLFVTVSSDMPPEDLSPNEIWLPLIMTDEDIDNGVLQQVVERINSSIYASALSDEERSNLIRELESVIRDVDSSWQTQSLALSLIVESEIEYIKISQGLNEDQAREEYHRRSRARLGYEFLQLVEIDGVKLLDIPFNDNSKKVVAEVVLDRLMSRHITSLSSNNFSVNESGGINIPINLKEELKSSEGLEEMLKAVRSSAAFNKLSPEKQAEFIEKLSRFYDSLPTDEMLREKNSTWYGYKHEWGSKTASEASGVLQLKCDELSKALSESEKSSGQSSRYSDSRSIINTLYEQAKKSNLAKAIEAEKGYLDIYAATLAIHGGGSEEEIRSRYDELLRQAHKEASGIIRAERLRDWIAYNIIDQDEFKSLRESIHKTNLAKARSQRRTDYLQVWLTNSYISKIRGKPTPKLESFGRGLDWDVPGQVDQIKSDAELARRFSLETERHADSKSISLERELNSALSKLRGSIDSAPEKVGFGRLIELLKELPLGVAARYVGAGIISFDQTSTHDKLGIDERLRGLDALDFIG